MKKEIVYYTCNTHREDIEMACRAQLLESGVSIISVSREKEIDFGDKRVVLQGKGSAEMMHRQILAGLEESDAEQVFLCENDVLYHPSHFEFDLPSEENIYYYNTNVWKYWLSDGLCVWVDVMQQLSGLTAKKDLLLQNYRARVARIDKEGKFFTKWGFEPGGKKLPLGFDDYPRENYQSTVPNVCIRHDNNLTKSKRSPKEFRNAKYAIGFKASQEIPGWDNIKERFTQ